jgi:adenylate kinase
VKNILFIAPPAGGKGTQSDRLVKEFGYVHISTGDLLRELDPESEIGKTVHTLISEGKLVSDEIVLSLLKDKLMSLKDNDAFILDGFPRNIKQAGLLDELLKSLNKSLDLVIELDVPYDVALKRAIGRVNCPKCKKTYNRFFMPTKVEGICDECGSALEVRTDDTEETYKTRYETYLSSTMPLIDFYKEAGKYVKIDGVNNTFETLVSVINND